jgi:hypothetical protein
MNEHLTQQLETLFIEAGSAHHRAFIHANGEDDAWALWYADYLYERLGFLLKRQFEPTQLADTLEQLETERKAYGIGNWAWYYAESFVGSAQATTT